MGNSRKMLALLTLKMLKSTPRLTSSFSLVLEKVGKVPSPSRYFPPPDPSPSLSLPRITASDWQVRLIHLEGFSDDERVYFRMAIQKNTLQGVQELIRGSTTSL